MARAQLTNNAVTALSAAISSTSATSLTVSAGGGNLFPSSGYFYITVVDSANVPEIMKVTARAVDVFTVVRGQDSTVARTFTSGARVSLNLVAAVVAELLDNNFDTATGVLPIANGGTGQSTLAAAQAALGFSAGTRLPFAQAAAPTGWVQDTSDSANSRMLRVVSGAGNNVGGTASPILMDVVPSHTHVLTINATNTDHGHTVNDPGHQHNMSYSDSTANDGGNVGAQEFIRNWGSGQANGIVTGPVGTGISLNGMNVNAAHAHTGSAATNAGASNWAPRYIDLIICAKS